MPESNRVAVKFHTKDDQYVFPVRPHNHRIAIYATARQEALLTWYRARPDAPSRQNAARLTKALVEHWLAEGEKLRRNSRFLAAIGSIREAVRLDSTPAARATLAQ